MERKKNINKKQARRKGERKEPASSQNNDRDAPELIGAKT
jgi:hypothetical protein